MFYMAVGSLAGGIVEKQNWKYIQFCFKGKTNTYPLFFTKDKYNVMRHANEERETLLVYPKVNWSRNKKNKQWQQNVGFQVIANNLSPEHGWLQDNRVGYFILQGELKKSSGLKIPFVRIRRNHVSDKSPIDVPVLWSDCKHEVGDFISVKATFLPHKKAWGVKKDLSEEENEAIQPNK